MQFTERVCTPAPQVVEQLVQLPTRQELLIVEQVPPLTPPLVRQFDEKAEAQRVAQEALAQAVTLARPTVLAAHPVPVQQVQLQ